MDPKQNRQNKQKKKWRKMYYLNKGMHKSYFQNSVLKQESHGDSILRAYAKSVGKHFRSGLIPEHAHLRSTFRAILSFRS